MTDDMEPDDIIDQLVDDTHGDLAKRLTDAGDGYMLVKYLTIADVMDAQGERSVLLLSSKDMQAWESLGMLEYARQVEQAGLVADDGQVQ